MASKIVAIVGKPNTGKSTLFNRMIQERFAIVEDQKGVTRDRIYGTCNWLTKDFRVIDTGGIEIENTPFLTQIKAQVEIAIEEADVIIFVVDGRCLADRDDEYVARMLQGINKPVIIAANKVDNMNFLDNTYDYYRLGFSEIFPISCSHGIGIGDLLDRVVQLLPNVDLDEELNAIKFSVIGRPNVGKSSLTNAILNEERVIVSELENTTRDAIDTNFSKDGQNYVVIDTAGLKKKGKIYENIDKYALIRTLGAIERSDVVLVVIDAVDNIQDQDTHIAGLAHESGKAVILVINKWDLIEKDDKTMIKYEKEIRAKLKYLDYAPIVFLSSKTHKRVHNIFSYINFVYENNNRRVQTSVLNDVILDAQIYNAPHSFNGGKLKIYYANQVAVAPPKFIIFVNDDKYLHFGYERYLENRIRENFEFTGANIQITARKKG